MELLAAYVAGILTGIIIIVIAVSPFLDIIEEALDVYKRKLKKDSKPTEEGE